MGYLRKTDIIIQHKCTKYEHFLQTSGSENGALQTTLPTVGKKKKKKFKSLPGANESQHKF